MLIVAWTTIVRSDAETTRARAGAEDPGRRTVYSIVLLTSFVTIVAATFVARHAESVAAFGESSLLAGLCFAALAVAWGLTHTAFTLRYAHLYYRQDEEGVGGITFAGDEAPQLLRFCLLRLHYRHVLPGLRTPP